MKEVCGGPPLLSLLVGVGSIISLSLLQGNNKLAAPYYVQAHKPHVAGPSANGFDHMGLPLSIFGTAALLPLNSHSEGTPLATISLPFVSMVQLSLRHSQLKFKTAGKLPTILEEFIEYTPRKTGGCQHVTGWTGISTGYAQKSPQSLH